MSRMLYSLLLRLALPFAVAGFLWRGWWRPSYRGSLRQRLALGLTARADRPLWLHAASVGEVQALAPLLRILHGRGAPLLLTIGTPTGMAQARRLFADLCAGPSPGLTLQAAPWDLPGAARRFIAAARPRAGVFIETELWPNRVAAARAAAVPLLLVSARLSARSLARYRAWARSLMGETMHAFTGVGAQSEADLDRFVQLGARAAAVSVTGNLKFDLSLPGGLAAQAHALREAWVGARWLWVAGSTHPGEEAACLSAHRRLQQAAGARGLPAPLLVLAPRRPERFDEVARWLAAQGCRVARTTGLVDADAEVVLVDEMGRLLAWYAAADAAFVGGSLVPVGGHNLLEPAALGRPLLAGPHGFQAPEIPRVLEAAGALHVVHDGAALGDALCALHADPARARQLGERAAAVVAAGRGAIDRAVAMIAALPGAD